MSATIEQWMEGTEANVRATFKTESVPGSGTFDTLTDPTTVTFTARRRGDTATSYLYGTAPEVTRVSLGLFRLKFVPAQGTWAVHVQGTGAAYGAEEIEFVIAGSEALA